MGMNHTRYAVKLSIAGVKLQFNLKSQKQAAASSLWRAAVLVWLSFAVNKWSNWSLQIAIYTVFESNWTSLKALLRMDLRKTWLNSHSVCLCRFLSWCHSFRGPGMTATLTTPEEPAMHSDLRVQGAQCVFWRFIYLFIYLDICVYLYLVYLFFIFAWVSGVQSAACTVLGKILAEKTTKYAVTATMTNVQICLLVSRMYVCVFVCVCQDVSYIVLCNCTAGLDTFCTEWHQDWPAQVRWKECGPFSRESAAEMSQGKVDFRDDMSCITLLGNGAKEPTEINHAPKFTLGCQTHWDSSHCLTSVQPLPPLRTACPMSIWCPRFGPPSWNSTRDRVCQPRRSGRIVRLRILQRQFS